MQHAHILSTYTKLRTAAASEDALVPVCTSLSLFYSPLLSFSFPPFKGVFCSTAATSVSTLKGCCGASQRDSNLLRADSSRLARWLPLDPVYSTVLTTLPPLFVFMPPLTFTFLPPPAAASHACLIQQRDIFEYRGFEFDRLDDCRRARKLLLFDREKMCQARYRNDTMQAKAQREKIMEE